MSTKFNNVKVEAIEVRILNTLKDDGEQTRTDLMRVLSHYTPADRKEAFNRLINSQRVKQKKVETIKPGPNPVYFTITENGEQRLAHLKAKHGIEA